MVLMSPTVWISTTTPEITFDSANPGDHWQRVGEIDAAVEGEFWKSVQRGSSRVSEFYLSGDPDNAWVQAAKRDPVLGRHQPLQLGSRLHRWREQEIPRQHRKGRGHHVPAPPATRTPSRQNSQIGDGRD
jgi:hypothetical protein